MLPFARMARTNDCLSRIATQRSALDHLGPLPRSWTGRTRRDLEAEAIAASTRMEGVPITVDEARRILAGDVPAAVSLEERWGRHQADDYAAFTCLGPTWNPDADVTPFVEAHVCAQATQVEALSLRQAIEHAVWTLLVDVAVHDLGLQERAANALHDAFHAREVTNRYYRGLCDVSAVTASHDLGKLAAAGMLHQRGGGRSAHYVGTEQLMDAVARGAGIAEEDWRAGASIADKRDDVLVAIGRRLHGGSDDGRGGTPG